MVDLATVLWGIWKTRNRACFENKWPKEPHEVSMRVSFWIEFWSKLQVMEGAKLELQQGAKVLERVASEIFRASRGWTAWRPRLRG